MPDKGTAHLTMGTASDTMLHCVYATDCCLQQEMEELWAMELAPMEKSDTGSDDEFPDEYDLTQKATYNN